MGNGRGKPDGTRVSEASIGGFRENQRVEGEIDDDLLNLAILVLHLIEAFRLGGDHEAGGLDTAAEKNHLT
jgi:hypothetical protein